jgi:hypothetical protein
MELEKDRNILDFIEDYTCGLVDAEETHGGANERHQHEECIVGGGEVENVIVLDTIGGIAFWWRLHRFTVLGSWRTTG